MFPSKGMALTYLQNILRSVTVTRKLGERKACHQGQAGWLPGKQELDEVTMVHTLVLTLAGLTERFSLHLPEDANQFLISNWCMITKHQLGS